MRLLARAVAVTTTSLLVIGFLPGQSFAATGPLLTGTVPTASSFISAPPSTISATFDTALAPSSTLSVAGPAPMTCPVAPPAGGKTLSCTPAAVGPPGTALPDGAYTVTYSAVALPPATGTTPGSFSFTVDTAKPGVAVSVVNSPNPYLKAHQTAGAPIVVSFQAEPGSVPSVSLSSTGGGSTLTVVATEPSTAGSFTASFPNSIADGTLQSNVDVIDRAGNHSGTVQAYSAKDTSAPAVVSSTPGQGGSVKSGTSGSPTPYDVVADQDLGAASAIVITDALATDVATTTTISANTIRVTPTVPLAEGDYTAKITLVDPLGNAASTVTRTFTVDNTVPALPVITAPTKINKANQATYVVSGTGEKGAIVNLTLGSTVPSSPSFALTPTAATLTNTATVLSDGTWTTSTNVTSIVDGAVSLSATQTDAAGNTSSPGTKSTTKDVVIPRVTLQQFDLTSYNAAHTAATVTGKVDNGSSTTGEADPFTISIDDTDPTTAPVIASGTAAANGSFTAPAELASLKDGVLTATVVATDSSGNPSDPATATAPKDTGAPLVDSVVVTNPINGGNQTLVNVHGVTEKSANVKVTVDDTNGSTPAVSKDVVANASTGAYSASPLDVTSLQDGVLTVSVVATDALGNPSIAGTATTTKDTANPTDPTLVVPTYVSNATVTAVPVSGTGEVASTVLVSASDATATPAVQKTVTVLSDGTWSALLDVHTLSEGSITITAVAKDAAGNLSGTTSKTTIKDTLAPGAPATLVASPAPYLYANRAADLTVSGTDASADRSAADLVADITVTDGVLTLTATDVPVAVTTGAFSHAFPALDVATLKDGTLVLSAKVRDKAGNVGVATPSNVLKDTTKLALVSTTPPARVNSAPSTSGTFNQVLNASTSTVTVKTGNNNPAGGSLAFGNGGKTVTFTPSSAFNQAASPYTVQIHGVDVNDAADIVDSTFIFTVDTTAPALPVYVTPATINKGNQAAYIVKGTGEVGATVHLTMTGGPTLNVSAPVLGDGSWVTSTDVSSLADGPVSLSATQTDGAGNTGPAATASVTKDTVAPVITNFAATDTNTATPATAITGTTEPGVTVSLSAADMSGPPTTDAGTVAPDGALTGALNLAARPDGQISVSALATDAAGNTSDPVLDVITKDSTPPVVTGLAASAVNVKTPSTTVTGSTTGGTDTVVLSATQGTATPVTGPATVNPLDGTFTGPLDLSSFGDGPITVSATATDTAGNTGTPATTTLSKDGTVPTISNLAATDTTSATPSTTVTGTRSELSSVAISATDGDTTVYQSVPSGTGDFLATLDVSTFADGGFTVKAVATDSAGPVGNIGQATTSASKDATAAAVAHLTATNTNVANHSSAIAGTTEPLATVALSATDGSHPPVTGAAIVASDGSFTGALDVSALNDGPISLSAVATDSVGNVGSATTGSLSKDTSAPAVSGLSATPVNVNAPSTTVTGSTTSGTDTVALSATQGAVTPVTGVATVNPANGSFTGTLDLSSFGDGPITVHATPTDAALNPGSPATTTLSKDGTVPTISQLVATATNVATPSTTVSGTRSEFSSVQISATDGSGTVFATIPAGDGSFSVPIDLSTFNDGIVTVTAVPKDLAANTGSATTTTSKDATRPVVTGLAATDTSAATVSSTVSGSVSEASVLVITVVDGTTTLTKSVSVAEGSFSFPMDVSSLPDGQHTLTVTATDLAGNPASSAVTATTTKDATAPVVSGLAATASTSGSPLSTVTGTVSDTTATVTLVATDHLGGTVSGPVTVVSGSFTKTLDLSTLADGVVNVVATATDSAGNTGTGSVATTRATKPGRPLAPTVEPGDTDAVVSFDVPTTTGYPVTSYTVTASPGGATKTGASSPLTVSGLANGTDYTFKVTATNFGGTSDASPASDVATPLGFSDVTLNALPSRVRAGTVLSLAGTVSRSDTSTGFGQVSLWVRYDDGSFLTLATIPVASNGTFRRATTAQQNGSYFAIYEGDLKNDTWFSQTRTAQVLVNIVVRRANPTAAASVLTVSGNVGPNKAGRTIALNRVLAGGKLQPLAKTVLTSSSAFFFKVKLPKGAYTLQVSFGSTAGNLGNTANFPVNRT